MLARSKRGCWVACALVAIGCSAIGCSADETPAPPAGDAGAAPACAPGEKPLGDGSCQPAGVPPERCGAGFTADDVDGCVPVMPPDACPKGSMATPGDGSCRAVAPCGSGTYGSIPVTAETQYVDASYAGGASDGTVGAPWTTIQGAIDAAAPGAIVAIAAGSYAEDLVLTKPVQVWGVCPERVEIVGDAAAVLVEPGADGAAVRDVALRGLGSYGVAGAGSQDIMLERVWVHDTARGIEIGDASGPSSATLKGVLVEHATEIGVLVFGATVTIDSTVVRATQPLPDGSAGRGMGLQDDADKDVRGDVTLRGSLIEDNHGVGIYVWGAHVAVDSTVVRATQPLVATGADGRGIGVEDDEVWKHRADVTIRSSVIVANREFGLFVAGSDALLEGTVVRDTAREEQTRKMGRGINVQDDGDTGETSNVTVRECLVERNLDIGVAVFGSELTIESAAIRDTSPRDLDGTSGRGISLQPGDTGAPPKLTLSWSTIDRSHAFGVVSLGGDVTAVASAIRETAPDAALGTFGDGLTAYAYGGPAHGEITSSRIDASARAAVSCFGSSIEIAETDLECNGIDIDGEPAAGGNYAFTDHGGNRCGCDGSARMCTVLTTSLAPPDPVAPGTP